MLDIKWIRDHPDLFDQSLKRRFLEPASVQLIDIDSQRRKAQTRLQELQKERNNIAKAIGDAKKKGDHVQAEDLLKQATLIKDSIPEIEEEERHQGERLQLMLSYLPNILEEDVPEGCNEQDNVQINTWGTPRSFDFTPRRHYELGEALGLMDFETAGKISGARFVVLKGALARLERALGQFMLDLHTQEFGYQEVSPPYLVREEALFGTGQLPKFSQDNFQTTDGRWLIPTAEVSLTNLVRESVVEESTLPLRFTAFTPSFRSEAGAAGRDTRGMIRQHQFHKVELVSITHPTQSAREQDRMLSAATTVLQRLNLPYRVMLLSSGDTGATVRRTYDIEVWLPGENTFREISSCSLCGDFQARRLQARFRSSPKGNEKPTLDYVHTLNGSGVAVGRALIAVLENYQNKDGSITLPDVLQPYMNCSRILLND